MAVRLNIDSNRDKLVFLEHGLGARKEYPHMMVLEEIFANNGYNVVNLDATNSLNASEQSALGITTTGHYQDLEDVIEWAKTQDFYTEQFALAGQSLGAISAVRYAGQFPQKVNLLIPCAFPYYNYNEQELNSFAREIIKNGFYDKVSKSTGRVLHMTNAYVEDMKSLDLSKQIENITANTFVLIGLADNEKHIKNSKALYEMLNCKKQIYFLPNVPHDLANTPETKATFEKALTEIFDKLNFKPYFEKYYQSLKNMYVDEIISYDDFKMVRSNIIDDGIWNFIYDIKVNNYDDFVAKFNQSKQYFKNRVPRFYILKSDENAKYLNKLKENYNLYCEDSWFNTPLNKLDLKHKAKIDVDIELSNNKQEIIDCIMEGFSTHDPNDPYGDLSPTYKESLNKKLFNVNSNCKTYHYIAKYKGKVVSIAGITIFDNNAYLNNVTTLKEYKGKGISKELLSYIVKELKNKKIQNIIFATETGAYTEAYYKKLGFEIVDYGYCFEEKE